MVAVLKSLEIKKIRKYEPHGQIDIEYRNANDINAVERIDILHPYIKYIFGREGNIKPRNPRNTYISRKHLVIESTSLACKSCKRIARWFIQDLDSENGTAVNGELFGKDLVFLEDGHVISIPDTKYPMSESFIFLQ